jgi:hypothetical protein
MEIFCKPGAAGAGISGGSSATRVDEVDESPHEKRVARNASAGAELAEPSGWLTSARRLILSFV